MNILYLILGIIFGIIFIGRGKNAKNKKFLPYEVKTKLSSKKNKEDFENWCSTEARGCRFMGFGFIIFGLSATFADSNVILSIVLAVIALVIFIIGFFTRIRNNKTKLGHFFAK